MDLAHRNEILLGLMLHHCGQQIVYLSRSTEEHLALAILYVLLYIERNGLSDTEILHVLGYLHTHFLCQLEEIINGMTRGEDDCRIVEDAYFLLTELLRAQSFNLYERTEYEFHVEVLGYVIIRRFLACRLGLRY